MTGAIKRILVAVDHSAPSLRAADAAADIASCCGAELVLLTVLKHVDAHQPELARYMRNEHSDESVSLAIEDAARGELSLLGERLVTTVGRPGRWEVEIGDPAASVVSFADRIGADLIAMGHTGRGQLTSLILGSVAKRVIDTARCPILVVR
jgi:nucleotide-binding universal stress UspA family protein